MKNKKLLLALITIFFISCVSTTVFADEGTEELPIFKEIKDSPISDVAQATDMIIPYKVEVKNNGFIIILDENPSTGYQWEFTLIDKYNEEFDPIVKLINEEFILPDSKLVGAGGSHIFEFETIKDGECALRFNYKRNWEEEEINSVQFEVTINNGKLSVATDLEMDGMDVDITDVKKASKSQEEEARIGIEESVINEREEPIVDDAMEEELRRQEEEGTISADESVVSEEKPGFFKSILNFFSNLFSKIFG